MLGMSTICAISTPLAQGGISVIRISGEDAINVASAVFVPQSCDSVQAMAGYSCAYGKITDSQGRTVDDGVLTVFRAPRSYTGEDVCEISCHGGIYVTKKVLRLCLAAGAKLADRGEFTKRAFLNGKLSLTQAEAVMDTISAQGEFALNSANLARQGKLFEQIKRLTDRLVEILGELAAWVDYPEEDLPQVETQTLKGSLENAIGVLDKILENYDRGLVFKSGIDTCIAGKPNVGKSALMNMLLGFERSIVTDIAGTTRDVIQESAQLGSVMLKLSDTAGIHETNDTVEQLGVELAKKRLDSANLIMAVFDSSQALDEQDRQLLEYISKLDKHKLIILNKTDLETAADKAELESYGRVLEISAKNGEGLDEIQAAVEEMFGAGGYDADSDIFANERQKTCVDTARVYLKNALESLESGQTLDAVTVMIDYAADALLELTGEKATEAVVNNVFSKFCVGK